MKMRRIISLILVLSALFTLSACNTNKGEDSLNAGGSGIEGGSGETNPERILFSKEVNIKKGVSADIDFVGYENNVRSLCIFLNGVETGRIDVTEVSESVYKSREGALSSDKEFMYKGVDANFDGFNDFMIESRNDAERGVSYFLFLWDDEAETFVFSACLDSPLFDEANSRIYTTSFDKNLENVGVYSVAGGKITLENSFTVGEAVEFTKDISDYEQYMNPEDRDGYLILVNKTNLIDSTYEPDDLRDLADTRSDRSARQMRYTAAMALEAMYIEMRAAGYTDVSVTSAYRPYSEQNYLYNLYTEQEMAAHGYSLDEAHKVVDTYSAAPGTSEHQTGLCCDMHNLPAADQAFAREEVYNWLTENAWKFGFILRFPEDKEDITTYEFEPWHYRFVGRYHAQKIHNFGLCLEEYLELIEE